MRGATVFRDCGWETGLGTCFYDRRVEAERLAALVDRFTLVLLAGPRNAGKSELARYTLLRLKRVKPLVIDARRMAAGALVGDKLQPLGERLAGALLEALREKAGLGRLVDAALAVYQRLGFDRYIVVDEVHLAANDPIRELEAVAKMLRFYPEYRGWRMVATCSEGALLASGIDSRLDGYGAWVMLLEPLDERHARMLYEEYVERNGCGVSFEAYWGLVGGLPGYLPDVCSMSGGQLVEWVDRHISILVQAVLEAAGEAGLDARRACLDAYELLVARRRLLKPSDPALARVLVGRNVAYPKGLELRPQLNVYRVALRLWAESGCREPPDPREVLEAATRGRV